MPECSEHDRTNLFADFVAFIGLDSEGGEGSIGSGGGGGIVGERRHDGEWLIVE